MSDASMDRRAFLGTCGKLGLGTWAGATCASLGGLSALSAVEAAVGNVSNYRARYWEAAGGNRVKCLLCPHFCELSPNQHGVCKTRINRNGVLVTLVYGKPTVVNGDPIEKAPLFHFLPGSRTLAVGTAGCNQHCKYCQNWEFTQAYPEKTDNKNLSPESMVDQCVQWGIPIIIFTLNDPVQCFEYLIDTAKWARSKGLLCLAHTGGYVCPEPLAEMCQHLDAISIDLKGFTQEFYTQMTGAKLDVVLSTIKTVHQSGKWLELVNLVVPGYNDDTATFRRMCEWILASLSPTVPLCVSRFFPKYQLRNLQAASPDSMRALRKLAYDVGLRYVYLGNMPGDPGESTYCPKCGYKILKRSGSTVSNTGMNYDTGRCAKCGCQIPGVWKRT